MQQFDGSCQGCTIEEVARDINLVIDAKVPHLAASFSRDLQEHLKRSLRDAPHRTYLWLHLMLDVIREGLRKKTHKHIDQILRQLPQSITSAYASILNRSGEKKLS